MRNIAITEEMKQYFIKRYLETYSVSEVMRNDICKGIGRKRVEDVLKKERIYEGLRGENYLKRKVENNIKTLSEKYGIINWGQRPDGGYAAQNKISYKRFSFLDFELKQYRELVEEKTKKNLKNITPSKYCYYTGILFADEEQEKVNPNDPRKRSVDHKIPVIICFINNVDPKIVASLDNIVFVLKYVNTIKGNTLHDSFLAIAPKIRKLLKDEGYKSN